MSFNGKPKSFVTRQGRITSNQRKALDSFWNRFVISNISEIREHIDNQYTLMDIGFGAGETLISIAKKEEHIYLSDLKKIILNKKSDSLKLIQFLRDEAHRFCLSKHRLKRNNSFLKTNHIELFLVHSCEFFVFLRNK